jgi:uncharacterized membrane protein
VQAIAGWRSRLLGVMRIAVLVAAAASPLASHVALLTGRGVGVAVALGVLQAVAVGIIIAGIGGARRHRGLAVLASACMLAVLAFGVMRSPTLGLRLAAGTSHALLYTALCVVFAVTLLPGHTDVVTRIAQRLNPNFHPGMRFYTRRVTIAWCLFFAGQILVSALLLLFAPERWWLLFVNALSVPLMVLMFLGEYIIRRRIFPGAQSANVATMVRGLRRPRAAPPQVAVDASDQVSPPGARRH